MNAGYTQGVRISSLLSQLSAVSQRLGVEPVPCSMTPLGLSYARPDPSTPVVRTALAPLLQTSEPMARREFAQRLPFDASAEPRSSLASEWAAMQSLTDGARAEAALLADMVRGDSAERGAAAAKLHSYMAQPLDGVSIVPHHDQMSGYRKAFIASLRTALLLEILLGPSHLDVAACFFQAAVNLLQLDRPPAAAMFAEIAAGRLAGVEDGPARAREMEWYSAFAARSWLRSRNASDPPEIARFAMDRGIFSGWSANDSRLMVDIFEASEALNSSLGLHAEAAGDVLRAAMLMLEQGRGADGDSAAEAAARASAFIGRAAEYASKASGMRGSAEILREMHFKSGGRRSGG